MTTLPNMGLVLPTRGPAGAGTWDDTVDANYGREDEHNHTTGRGLPITSAAITVDADISFGSAWAPTNLQRIQFASVEPLAGNNKSLFVADGTGGSTAGELYWRSNAGSNVKLTSGASLNVAAFTGGIGGDYASVGAAVAFDDSGDRYTFKQQSPGSWARLASGDLRLFETGTTESVFVGLAAPAALAGSYTITLPLTAPASTAIVQMSSAGILTASNDVASVGLLSGANHALLVAPGGLASSYTVTMPAAVPGSTTAVKMSSAGTLSVDPSTHLMPGSLARSDDASVTATNDMLNFSTSTTVVSCPCPCQPGAVISAWKVYLQKTSASGTISASVQDSNMLTGPASSTVGTSQSNSANNPGFIQLGQTGLSVTIAANHSISISIVPGGTTGDRLLGWSYTVTP